MRNLLCLLLFLYSMMAYSQDSITDNSKELPYAIIPDYPESYSAGTIAARVVDGLGFRYYWGTEGLRSEDLEFKPNEDARTTEETINHIYQLTNTLKNATLGKANGGDVSSENMSFEEKRATTLLNIKAASDILRTSSDEEVASYKLIFKRKDGSTTEYPFWNMLNGPLADAIWHVGQVVSFRRSSGNPFNSNMSLFNGRSRN